MARFRFGLDAELDPRQLALASQANDKSICDALGEFVVSLYHRDAQGGIHHAATGLFVIQGKDIVVTAKHSLPTGSDQLLAFFADGTSAEVGILATDSNHDIAILTVNRAFTMPALRRSTVYIGDIVYLVGFPSDNQKLNFTKGIVSSVASDGMFTTTAYADNGEDGCTTTATRAVFSGGPVVNLHMELVGMVRGVEGVTNQVSCIMWIDGFASGTLAMRPP